MNRMNLEYQFQKTLRRILCSPEELCRFLDASAAICKYGLTDQILIHAFIPSPKAVATFEQWKQLGRGINRGAVGAYHFSGGSAKCVRADLFDVADTNGPTHTEPRLWEYPKDVSLYLVIGLDGEESDRGNEVREIVDRTVGSIFAARSGDSEYIRESARHQELISAAAAYTLIRRIGLPAEAQSAVIAAAFEYAGISSTADSEKVGFLSLVTTAASTLLRTIERSVKHGGYRERISTGQQKQPEAARTAAAVQDHDPGQDDLSARPGNRDLSPAAGGADAGQVRPAAAEAPARAQRHEGVSPAGTGEVPLVSGGRRAASGDDVRAPAHGDEGRGRGAGELRGASAVAHPDRRGGPRTGDGGALPHDLAVSVAAIAGVPENETEPILSALAFVNSDRGLSHRIGAFFAENTDAGARAQFLRQAHGLCSTGWDLSAEPKNIAATERGMHVRIERQAGVIDRRFTWEQATYLYDLHFTRQQPQAADPDYAWLNTRAPDASLPQQISLYGEEPTQQTDEDRLREELVAGGKYYTEEQGARYPEDVPEPGFSSAPEQEKEKNEPATLKELLERPETVTICEYGSGGASLKQALKNLDELKDRHGVHAKQILLPGSGCGYLLYSSAAVKGRKPAAIRVRDEILFGTVHLCKLEDGQPAEPAPGELESWRAQIEQSWTAAPFTTAEIAHRILEAREDGQLAAMIDAETYRQADTMNPHNRLRVLVVEPGKMPEERLIENSEEAFRMHVGGDIEYYAREQGVDVILSADTTGKLNQYLNGEAVYGTFLVTRVDDDGVSYADLDDQQLERYRHEFAPDVPLTEYGEAPEQIEGAARATPAPVSVPEPRSAVVPVEAAAKESEPPREKNYRFSDGTGIISSGARARYRDNVAAIQTLYALETDDRSPQPHEQELLAKYAGWGGLPEAFDAGNPSWKSEYEELRELLTPEEYTAARASTPTSFYTPIPVMKAIYQALESFGIQPDARILEPCCGAARFFGAVPASLVNARLYGVEIDGIPARIAQKLYPDANIRHGGFENTQYADNRFDAAIGNVPFGNFQVADARYDRYRFLIHDYFFAKSLDKVRPGGVAAFVTSSGTMDKKTANARRYLAQRADLIGAVRLPDNTFQSAGAGVMTDIVFLQKREILRAADDVPEWVEIPESELQINPYFTAHPEMILGEMAVRSGPFGPVNACVAPDDFDLEESLTGAVARLRATVPARTADLEQGAIEAPPEVRNFTFTVRDGTLYYREHDLLLPQAMTRTELARVAGMCEIRDTVRELIRLQPATAAEQRVERLRAQLGGRYDSYVQKHGNLNDDANTRLFRKDVDCNLLFALEQPSGDGNWKKADIFSRRTVDPRREITVVDSARDALPLSINHRGRVDVEYMATIYHKEPGEIIDELAENLYLNPSLYNPEKPYSGWELDDEYLSGNVRKKLAEARTAAEQHPELFARNVAALEQSLPDWVEAGQIEARLGASWIGRDYFTQFMYETFGTPRWLQGNGSRNIHIVYNPHDSRWSIYNKNADSGVRAKELFGTGRANAYSILEDTLNLKSTEVRDKQPNGGYALNHKETELARAKQAVIKNEFAGWVFRDAQRRHELEQTYNSQFNSVRTRRYDGSALTLPGLSSTFVPRDHQKNAALRICDFSCHTLLDHRVGYGKTATMIIGGYESVRLGLARRVMYAVPNHIAGQFRDEIYRLYPDARALIVTEADFQKDTRQQFLSRIIYSDVEMIVLGHTQFERIPMSPEYHQAALENEISELSAAIAGVKAGNGARLTIKQMEKQEASLRAQIIRLQNEGKKDQLVTFEEMGVDVLCVDEADLFKNCYIFSKMRNVAGIGASSSRRAAGMLMKCRYINRKGGKIVFATGTPISNALSEMYVMQRYLQEDALHERAIHHFDEWASDFAEAGTSLELAPEGSGFRQRTRLSRYFNIPELMQLYRQVADVQIDAIPGLDVPRVKGGEPEVIVCEPSEILLDWVQEGVARCRAIRERTVAPDEDNMLKFTREARLAGLDMRLLDPDAPFDPNGKIAQCAGKLVSIYNETMENKGFQLVFCDDSTPKPDKFDVYTELKRVCVQLGIPANEIAFVHDAKNSRQWDAMKAKCRSGEIRILVGSTEKCGAGTNVQDRLAALHELDCPYRPRDIEQREGRGLRQGNMYKEISVCRYVTERSFDAYLWNIVSTKQRFISQIRQASNGRRVFEDKDEMLLSFEAVQAVATGNPLIMEKINLENELSRLQLLQSEHRNAQYRLEDRIIHMGKTVTSTEQRIARLQKDIETVRTHATGDAFRMTVSGTLYENREEAGQALLQTARTATIDENDWMEAGEYQGLKIVLYRRHSPIINVSIKGERSYDGELNDASGIGTVNRIDNVVKGLPGMLKRETSELESELVSIVAAKAELGKPFPQEQELAEGLARMAELNVQLNLDKQEQAAVLPDDEDTAEKEHDGAGAAREALDLAAESDLEI